MKEVTTMAVEVRRTLDDLIWGLRRTVVIIGMYMKVTRKRGVVRIAIWCLISTFCW